MIMSYMLWVGAVIATSYVKLWNFTKHFSMHHLMGYLVDLLMIFEQS